MLPAADTSMNSSLENTNSLVFQIAEELWQKGYDLRRSGPSWIIKEPLSNTVVNLACDAELFKYAAGRVNSPLPEITIEPTKQFPAQPLPASDGVSPSDPNDTTQPTVTHSNWLPPELTSCFKPSGYVMGAVISIAILVSLWKAMTTSPTNQTPELKEQHAAASQSLDKFTRPDETVPAIPREKESAPAESSGSGNEVEDKRNLAEYSNKCAELLKRSFGAKSPSLLVSPRRSLSETCHIINGKEHCPYIANEQATLNYMDQDRGPNSLYACDVDFRLGIAGGARAVPADLDIVRFLLQNPSHS